MPSRHGITGLVSPIVLAPFAGLALSASQSVSVAAEIVCTIQSRSPSLVVMVCDAGGQPEDWRAAGQKACGSRSPCNVWIWEDRDEAPETAPVTDSGLSPSEAASAVAVWVNGSNRMILVRKVSP